MLDAGDLLAGAQSGAKPPRTPEEKLARARLVAAAYARLGLAALALGDKELEIGLAQARALAAEQRIALLAANVMTAKRGGRAGLAPHVLLARAGVRLGVFAVLDGNDPEIARALEKEGLAATDPAAAARSQARLLRSKGADYVVGLLHAGTARVEEILSAAGGVDLAIVGHGQVYGGRLQRAGQTIWVSDYAQGKYQGVLEMHLLAARRPLAVWQDTMEIEREIAILERQMGTLESAPASSELSPVQQAQRVARHKDLESRLAARRADLAAAGKVKPGESWVRNRMIQLESAIPDEPAIRGLMTR